MFTANELITFRCSVTTSGELSTIPIETIVTTNMFVFVFDKQINLLQELFQLPRTVDKRGCANSYITLHTIVHI